MDGKAQKGSGRMQYKDVDMQLKEQFIYGLNDSDTLMEIMCKLNVIKDTSIVTSE